MSAPILKADLGQVAAVSQALTSESKSSEKQATVILNDDVTHTCISGLGKFHTNDADASKPQKKLTPYLAIGLADIRALVDSPQQVDKPQAQWLIPSALHSRSHAIQKAQGAFWWLWADLDIDPLPLDRVQEIVELMGAFDYEIYTSRSATQGNQKSRILIPLSESLSGADWIICQDLLNDRLKLGGAKPDEANLGCGQLCYLPNQGEFYDSRSRRGGQFFEPLLSWSDDIALKHKAVREQEEAIRANNELVKARRPNVSYNNGQGSLINAFNQSYTVEQILTQAGYDQRGKTFRHPKSESGSYSASVKDRRVYSLSPRDPLYTANESNGAHDAFSAFTVLFANRDANTALKLAGDGYVQIGNESWNMVAQREFMKSQESLSGDALMVNQNKPAESAPLPKCTPITLDELNSAKLCPRVIVPNLLYADVRMRYAAGGTGKTTVTQYEAVMLALGRSIWGYPEPLHPIKTVLVTREDPRGILTARLREIINALNLTDDDRQKVLNNVRIYDLSVHPFRVSKVEGDVVEPHKINIEALISEFKDFAPDWMIFDPLVSFGVGEQRVNDAEQGLIESFRVICRALDCCVEGIHHVGKGNARDKTTDQYSGRGGSALSDGARMVAVMNPMDAKEWKKETGLTHSSDKPGIRISLPKLSYSMRQPDILVMRDGYSFNTILAIGEPLAPERAEFQVVRFIESEYSLGRKYSKTQLEGSYETMGLSRNTVRSAIVQIEVQGLANYVSVTGKAGSHFQPLCAGGTSATGSAELW
jgi:RecA-family ATPase